MMKKIVYLYGLLLLVMAACSESDEKLTNSIDFSSPYVITKDDPNDPVQSQVYQIYQKYGVPVFFADTIQRKLSGYDYEGNPVYQYETLDLRWRFSSYQHDVAYDVKEYKTQDEKLRALGFIDYYLQMVSKKMRPFCIYPVKSFEYDKIEFATTPYLIGFRTLTLGGIDNIADDAAKKAFCLKMIRSMALDRVKQNLKVVANFANISQKNKWYGLPWKGTAGNPGLACSYTHTGYWGFTPVDMFTNEKQFLATAKKVLKTEYTIEKAYEIRQNIMKDIGQYGFICGSKGGLDSSRSPDGPEYDMEFFVNTIVEIGDAEFKKRYGASPLVMQKYKILYDCIVNELGIDLLNL